MQICGGAVGNRPEHSHRLTMCSFMSGMEFSAEKATNEGLEFGAEDNSGYSILSAGSLVDLSRAK